MIKHLLPILLTVTAAFAADEATLELAPPDSVSAPAPKADTTKKSPAPVQSQTQAQNQGSNQNPPPTDTSAPIEKMPQITNFVTAVYPSKCMKQGLEGAVLLEMLIDTIGHVDSVRLVKSLEPSMDSAAMKAAAQFTFSPAIAGGKPVPVYLTYSYKFTLESVMPQLDTAVNFSGQLVEMGTRKAVPDAIIAVTFTDSTTYADLAFPFEAYRDRLGKIPGQSLDDGKLITTTDSLGNFTFRGIPIGKISVKAPVPGCEVLEENEDIKPHDHLKVVYHIKRVSYNDYEVVVYGKKAEKEVAHEQLNVDEVKKVPGCGGDAVMVVQALPGVARPTFNMGQIIVRGAPTWDSRFFVDGTDIPQLYHFGGIKSTYTSDALQTVNFYPGGWGTTYGGGTAGVIEIDGRPGATDRYHGKADISFLDGSALVEGPIGKKVSVLCEVRRSFIGEVIDFATKNISKLNTPINVAPFYWDYVARVDVNPTPDVHAFITAFGSKDELELKFPKARHAGSAEVDSMSNRIYDKTLFHKLFGGLDWTITPKLSSTTRISGMYEDLEYSILGMFKDSSPAWEGELREELTMDPIDRLKLHAGIDLHSTKTYMALKVPSADGTYNSEKETFHTGVDGAYINADIHLPDSFVVTPGLRYDYFPELKYKGSILPQLWDYKDSSLNKGKSGEPAFRISARWTFVPKNVIKAAFGTYSETPLPYIVRDSLYGNPRLPATNARHIVLGYEWAITDLINLDVQGYMNNEWDIPRSADSADLLTHPGVMWVGDGETKSRGIEIMLRHDQSKRFFGWIAYTLSKSESRNPHSDGWHLIDKDETNNLQLVASVRLPHNWETGIHAKYVTGDPYTPIVDKTWDYNSKSYIPKYGEANSARYAPYFGLDFRVEKKFIRKNWMLTMYFEFYNLNYFFYKSPEYRQYNFDYTQEHDIYNIPLPSLGLTADF